MLVVFGGSAGSFFPFFWLISHNSDYKDGFKLILPALMMGLIGYVAFGILYTLRLFDVITDTTLQDFARPCLLLFMFQTPTLIISLHYWKR